MFLVGLDSGGNYLDTTSGVYDSTKRLPFRNRALAAFDAITEELSGDQGHMQNEGKSILMWLQAYDYLKSSYEVSELRNNNRSWYTNFDSDSNS